MRTFTLRNKPLFFLPLLLSFFLIQSGQSISRELDFSAATANGHFKTSLDRLRFDIGKGDYARALIEGEGLRREEKQITQPALLLQFRRNLGGAQLGAGRYQDAVRTLLPARDLARALHDNRSLYSINNNLSWVYLMMDNLEAAGQFGDEALAAERASGDYQVRPLISRAYIYARSEDFGHAEPLFSEAISYALDGGDLTAAATAWHLLGASYLQSGKVSRAEIAETEAFRLKRLHHLPELDLSMRDLARTLAARGDLDTASVLMEQAVALVADPHSTAPVWSFYRERGRLRVQQGDLEAALPDLRIALELARRLDVIPTDDDRVTFESGLSDLYSLFIDTGNQVYLQNHDAALRDEIFEAAEADRAASLRALVPQPNGWRTRLPAEHAAVLGKLQAAERSMLMRADANTESQARIFHAALHEIESRAGSDEEPGKVSAVAVARQALDDDAAILAFHLGSQRSWLWAVTLEHFDVYALPGKAEIAHDAADFRKCLQSGSTNCNTLGEALGRKLLSPVAESIDAKHRWILALDQELFNLPLAAIEWRGRYLTETHALTVTPGVRLLEPMDRKRRYAGRLAGLGDAIYNQADPRWHGLRLDRDSLGLARLSGSAVEVASAVREWESGTVLIGADASKAGLLRAIESQPAILHLATHVIKSPRNKASLIVLGLNAGGEPDLLDMRDVLLQPISVQLVVMSGCASGDAEVLRSNGLMGLTRAWLGAGASEVLATRWPSLDDSGPFFSSFYRNLREYPEYGASEALHRAQIEMIHSNSFRNKPEYWASYFLVGKN